MTNDDPDSDEDWYDDDDTPDDEEASRCPACGGPIQSITDKCPACGYWLSADDRDAMGSGMRKPVWLRVTAWVVLAAFLFTLLAIGVTLF